MSSATRWPASLSTKSVSHPLTHQPACWTRLSVRCCRLLPQRSCAWWICMQTWSLKLRGRPFRCTVPCWQQGRASSARPCAGSGAHRYVAGTPCVACAALELQQVAGSICCHAAWAAMLGSVQLNVERRACVAAATGPCELCIIRALRLATWHAGLSGQLTAVVTFPRSAAALYRAPPCCCTCRVEHVGSSTWVERASLQPASRLP